jgi:hypothetical protein
MLSYDHATSSSRVHPEARQRSAGRRPAQAVALPRVRVVARLERREMLRLWREQRLLAASDRPNERPSANRVENGDISAGALSGALFCG